MPFISEKSNLFEQDYLKLTQHKEVQVQITDTVHRS
ncbi:hypothetical protein SAMN05421636_11237 [Pricia antarctica]|uniref:Uncharacterized protein n=1 Tax=Pricia antarctica TaxID=641691 RepID=A0A1G7IHU7_9FLAO|nr:hypothetical protein SAMN05421636_11237 [Pricia antarctica]